MEVFNCRPHLHCGRCISKSPKCSMFLFRAAMRTRGVQNWSAFSHMIGGLSYFRESACLLVPSPGKTVLTLHLQSSKNVTSSCSMGPLTCLKYMFVFMKLLDNFLMLLPLYHIFRIGRWVMFLKK